MPERYVPAAEIINAAAAKKNESNTRHSKIGITSEVAAFDNRFDKYVIHAPEAVEAKRKYEPAEYGTREFGARINEWLERTKISAVQLADEANISAGYLSALRTGAKEKPSKRVMDHLAAAMEKLEKKL